MADENGPGPDVKTADLAGSGLALLQLMADAADPGGNGWVNRRVKQLEFLDTRAVRWQVSVELNVPADAPDLTVGEKEYRLVPVMPWEKATWSLSTCAMSRETSCGYPILMTSTSGFPRR